MCGFEVRIGAGEEGISQPDPNTHDCQVRSVVLRLCTCSSDYACQELFLITFLRYIK